MIEEDKKNTKSIKEIIAKYKNKNFITADNAIITPQDFNNKNFFGIKPKKPDYDIKLLKSNQKDKNINFNEKDSDNSSLVIKNENLFPMRMSKINDNLGIQKFTSNVINPSDANVNQIYLDTSGNSFEMLNMVKKAMNTNNNNFNTMYKGKDIVNINLKDDIILKPSSI